MFKKKKNKYSLTEDNKWAERERETEIKYKSQT